MLRRLRGPQSRPSEHDVESVWCETCGADVVATVYETATATLLYCPWCSRRWQVTRRV